MKYIIIIGDGMADYNIPELGNKTPLMVADKPRMDYMAKHGTVGYSANVPEGMVPESDTANLAIMGYDPKIYSKGRSPLEALSMGIEMAENETAISFDTSSIIYSEYFIDNEDNSIVLKMPNDDKYSYYRLNYNNNDDCIHYHSFKYYAHYPCDIKFKYFETMPTKEQLFYHLGWSTNYKTYDIDFSKPIIGLKARMYDDRAFLMFVEEYLLDIFNFSETDSNYLFNTVPTSYYDMAGGIGAEICDSRVSSMSDLERYFRLYVSENVDISHKTCNYHEENGKLYANYGDKGGMLESLSHLYAHEVEYISETQVQVLGRCTYCTAYDDYDIYYNFTATLVLENGYWKFDGFELIPQPSSNASYIKVLKHK